MDLNSLLEILSYRLKTTKKKMMRICILITYRPHPHEIYGISIKTKLKHLNIVKNKIYFVVLRS